jgi:hypothetical protein
VREASRVVGPRARDGAPHHYQSAARLANEAAR